MSDDGRFSKIKPQAEDLQQVENEIESRMLLERLRRAGSTLADERFKPPSTGRGLTWEQVEELSKSR